MPVTINGDGLIEVGGTTTTQGRVRLAEDTDNGSNYVELTAPASVTANRTVTFPDANINFSTGLGVAQGGTGLTTLTAGNNALYSTSASALTAGTLPVAAGGTGATSLTANNVILGNGTSAVQVVAPGTNGNVLTSNGTTWQSTAPATVSTAFGGIGTYAVLMNAANSNISTGGTIAGSSLRYDYTSTTGNFITGGGAVNPFVGLLQQINNSTYGGGGSSLSGTWRKMSPGSVYYSFVCGCSGSTFYQWGVALYVRVS